MKLARQTLIYSTILMAVVMGLLIAYMMLMMPALYVAHRNDQNLADAKAIHRQFIENGNLADSTAPASAISLVLPKNGYQLRLYHRYFEGDWTIPPGRLRDYIDDLRTAAGDPQKIATTMETPDANQKEAYFDELISAVQEQIGLRDLPPEVHFTPYDAPSGNQDTAQRFYRMGDDGFVLVSTLRESRIAYSNYFLLTNRTDSLTLTMINVMTPDIQDIQPVIAGSLPMIVLVLGLVVLLTSQLFSRRIVQPVTRLAAHVSEARALPITDVRPIRLTGRDEITELGLELNALYTRLQASYRALEEAGQRRTVFLRASSHQLKTPIAAALLLVDGMINQVGRYSDRDRYLPAVKAQLKSMQTMVEDVLHLSRCEQQLEPAPFDLTAMVKRLIGRYSELAAARNIQIQTDGQGVLITDGELISKITDNLLSNAVAYTAPGGTIQISVSDTGLRVFNRPARIADPLMPHIFEPFVTGSSAQKGHGLGLYVVRYYADLLGLTVTLSHEADGVMVRLEATERTDPC